MSDAQKALNMIKNAHKKGRASKVSLVRQGTAGGYDPATNTWAEGTNPETFETIGVKINYTNDDIDGTRIKQGDLRLYIPAESFVRPNTGESLDVAGVGYVVISLEILAPGDTDILYICQIRGAA